jgi:Tol biopolymer transport system component
MRAVCHDARSAATGRLTAAVLAFPLLLGLAACGDNVVDPGDAPEEQILFLSTRVGDEDPLGRPMRDIFRVNVGGTVIENVSQQPAWMYWHLHLSPDGRRLAFSSSLDCDIWVMNTDGTGRTRLTNRSGGGEDRCNAWPRWSRDGARIAFATNREGRSVAGYGGLYDIYVMNADGSSPRNVSYSLGDALGSSVAAIGWSPGGQVVFETSSFADGTRDITVWLVNPDGTGVRSLFDTPYDHSPAWSPDGSRIAFISERDGQRRLHIMNADGSGVRPLTAHAGSDWLSGNRGGTLTAFAYDPWSPDGTRIAFDLDALNEWGTYVINADGTGIRRLSDHPTRFNGWSPDGTRIAFTSRRIPSDVYIVNADGSGLRNLTGTPYEDSDAIWLPRR